uniref:uncharacterized protein LOC120333741 n=1 Tax=Styela clava TaxID=7725 RepID=UPI00193A6FC7|nr:uncharacterized protein LOC120333741 [Styela clava]
MDAIKITCFVICLFHVVYGAFGPKRLYSMDIPTTPVSVKVVGKDLIIVGPWYIGGISHVHWKFRQPSRMKPRIINKDIANPRAVGRIPPKTFKDSSALTYWAASWGANETSGAMYVMRPTTTYSIWKDIAIDAGWNYERAQWVDMNRDGRIDCLTARFRGGVGQLLWFQQPKGQDKWGQQIIHEGMADGNFIGFVKGGKTYVLVAGLQFSTLGLYWTMSRTNLWSTSRMVRHRVIDNYGKFYDVQYIDLNKDGRPDALTTTVNVGNSRGHVLGYEIPNDIQNKIWNRRVLAAGFQGDYSPGKAQAFWPNKWKRKADRPSIFLSGAGQEMLFILTPKPARTGWGYVKSSLRAGTGMIGIPYIGDIDGDSYPEVFVPQGNKLHVFSYDYNAAVAEPPNTKTNEEGKITPRPVVKYRPPFFRPTAATLPPLIPRNASLPRLPASSGGLSGAAASSFGSSGILPSGNVPGTVAPLGNLPPLRTRGGGSSGGSGLPANFPRNHPLFTGSNAGSGTGGNAGSPRRQGAGAAAGGSTAGGGSNGLGGLAGTSGGAVSGGTGNSGAAPGTSGGSGGTFGLWPVLTQNGPVYIPVPNPQPNLPVAPVAANSPGSALAGGNNNNPIVPVRSPNNPIVPIGGGTSANNRIVPLGGGTSANNRIVPLGGGTSSNNPVVPLGGGTSPNNPIVPIGGRSPLFNPNPLSSNRPIVPLGGSSSNSAGVDGNTPISNEIIPIGGSPDTPRPPMQPVFEDETEPPEYEDYYTDPNGPYDEYYNHEETIVEKPPNLILSITEDSYRYREEAADACAFENKILCSLPQLEAAKQAGPIPLIEWGWFGMEGRAAGIHDCLPGEVKWQGYKCHNGVVGHTPVQLSTALKGYCCSIMRGANVTDRKFSNYHSAKEGCESLDSHICTLEEMFDVWEKSSYKSDTWGWYNDDQHLIKMVHTCDPKQVRWPGYECLSRKLATSQIVSFVQESAYCCNGNSGDVIKSKFSVLSIAFILYYFTVFLNCE